MPETSGTKDESIRRARIVKSGKRTVIPPQSSGLRVASKVKGCELDVSYRELLGGGVQGWLARGILASGEGRTVIHVQNSNPVVLEHMQQPRCVSRIARARFDCHTWSFQHCHCIIVSYGRLDSNVCGNAYSPRKRSLACCTYVSLSRMVVSTALMPTLFISPSEDRTSQTIVPCQLLLIRVLGERIAYGEAYVSYAGGNRCACDKADVAMLWTTLEVLRGKGRRKQAPCIFLALYLRR